MLPIHPKFLILLKNGLDISIICLYKGSDGHIFLDVNGPHYIGIYVFVYIYMALYIYIFFFFWNSECECLHNFIYMKIYIYIYI